jgi:hypothetical protein
MKNKFTILVLAAEIVAIVVLHTARSFGKPGDKSAHMQSESQFPIAEERLPMAYTSLK